MRAAILASVLLLSACSAPACLQGAARANEAQLFFGLTDEAVFTAFLDNQVTPRFPAGLTVLDAAGRWRNPAGQLTQERTKLVIIVAPPGPATELGLEAIRRAYIAQFHQQSVGLVTRFVCADF